MVNIAKLLFPNKVRRKVQFGLSFKCRKNKSKIETKPLLLTTLLSLQNNANNQAYSELNIL